MENIDLKTCSKGDILVSKHGKKFIYREYKPENMFPHVIQEAGAPKNLGWGSRLDNGQVFANNRFPGDLIMVIIGFILGVILGFNKIYYNQVRYWIILIPCVILATFLVRMVNPQ